MTILVQIFGALIAIMGLLLMISPTRFRPLAARFRSRPMTLVAALLRVVLGIFLISAAPACRLATLIYLLGFLVAMTGVTLIFVGQDRVQEMITWWLRQSTGTARVWALFAVLFGVFLIYAGS